MLLDFIDNSNSLKTQESYANIENCIEAGKNVQKVAKISLRRRAQNLFLKETYIISNNIQCYD